MFNCPIVKRQLGCPKLGKTNTNPVVTNFSKSDPHAYRCFRPDQLAQLSDSRPPKRRAAHRQWEPDRRCNNERRLGGGAKRPPPAALCLRPRQQRALGPVQRVRVPMPRIQGCGCAAASRLQGEEEKKDGHRMRRDLNPRPPREQVEDGSSMNQSAIIHRLHGPVPRRLQQRVHSVQVHGQRALAANPGPPQSQPQLRAAAQLVDGDVAEAAACAPQAL